MTTLDRTEQVCKDVCMTNTEHPVIISQGGKFHNPGTRTARNGAPVPACGQRSTRLLPTIVDMAYHAAQGNEIHVNCQKCLEA